MNGRTELGRTGEDLAVCYLQNKGWQILDRNVRVGRVGELDVVARRVDVVAFVEVKTRRSRTFGHPAEAITPAKQRRMRTLALRYLADRQVRARAVQFDVIEVEPDGAGAFTLRHLEGAF